MEVNLEIQPISWGETQGCTHVGEDWILLYEIFSQRSTDR